MEGQSLHLKCTMEGQSLCLKCTMEGLSLHLKCTVEGLSLHKMHHGGAMTFAKKVFLSYWQNPNTTTTQPYLNLGCV